MRTHYCGQVTTSVLDTDVLVCGWVHRRRDHGGVIFVDLRDREGIVQVVFDPDTQATFQLAESLRNEFVIAVKGRVRRRPEGTENPEMTTGAVEILGLELHVLSAAHTPPFQLDEYIHVGEETRLKYRYVDLRRPEVSEKLVFRSKVTAAARRYLESEGFLDIETPMLTRATPEGARDYLVPSRVHESHFYALPQSPQLFKQLLMVAGMDRYYQIVKCFRDEDLRADRQPEFTQIDIEASFVDEQAVMSMAEGMVVSLFKQLLDVDLGAFPVMPYAEAMRRYGSDKPDLRIPYELVDLKDVMKEVPFRVFSEPAASVSGRVAALCVPGGGEALTRKEIDQYTDYVKQFGAKGLAYIKVNDASNGREGLQSPIVKNLTDDALQAVLERTQAKAGDLIFFGADQATVVNQALGGLRVKLAQDLGHVESGWRPLWVVDFPMFEQDAATKKWTALHHPFTAPTCSVEQLKVDPAAALSNAYDMVLNGTELGGGSVRIHDAQLQQAAFDVLGIDEVQAQQQFGFLLDAFRFGAPPHAGIAFGLDRLVMLMTAAESIREVIAFPKTQAASCLMTQAPAKVETAQLQELGIRLKAPAKPVKESVV